MSHSPCEELFQFENSDIIKQPLKPRFSHHNYETVHPPTRRKRFFIEVSPLPQKVQKRFQNNARITLLVFCFWTFLLQTIHFEQSFASEPSQAKTTTRSHTASSQQQQIQQIRTNTMVNSQHSDSRLDRVCIIGSGNWGSAISTIVGRNCKGLPFYETQVNMWVFEEMVKVHPQDSHPRKLTEIINETHENVKYLPGIKLPSNIKAVADLAEACKGATLLIFVLPHQFLPRLLPIIRESSHPSCRGVSLIKGIGKRN